MKNKSKHKNKKFLSSSDRKTVSEVIHSNENARVLRRAIALKMADQGYSAAAIAQVGITCDKTVWNLREKYSSDGLNATLYDEKRSGKPPTITASKNQKIVAIACSKPPEGRARWTLDLLREETLKTGILKDVSREKIRLVLREHDLKPWRLKMWCVPKLDDEYIERMEDVLAIYEKPYDPDEPVVCLDEKPVQLLADKRDPQPVQSGRVARQDYEYKRNGTVNVFRAIEPKAGRHFTKVTPNRKKPKFAAFVKSIVRAYPKAKKIHLVMDNLNTHKEGSLIETFGLKEGHAIWSRVEVHHTPKHASWLNQAEIGIGIYARQCIGKNRVATIEELKTRSMAWNRDANRRKIKIDWQFTRKKARQKFGYKSGKN